MNRIHIENIPAKYASTGTRSYCGRDITIGVEAVSPREADRINAKAECGEDAGERKRLCKSCWSNLHK